MIVTYKRHIFRSVLEKDFAQYFDGLGLEWKYEPMTVTVTGGNLARPVFYTPDFYLPDFQAFIECKPTLMDGTKEKLLISAQDALKVMLFYIQEIERNKTLKFYLATERAETFQFYTIMPQFTTATGMVPTFVPVSAVEWAESLGL